MKSILVQLDTDTHSSVFDRVVAVDAGVEHLFSYSGVTLDTVTGLVHGCIFTRGPADLKNSAVFVGGSDVSAGELILKKVCETFFGPMRVSVMMDSNGCNTTAAAAVAMARRHVTLAGSRAIVLGATGPVGLRAAELLAAEGAGVTVVSRTKERAATACETLRRRVSGDFQSEAAVLPEEAESLCQGHSIIIAAGAAGICFLNDGALRRIPGVRVAIDLNAVPPAGIADIGVMDKGTEQSGVCCYGALGVGGLKMKVHKRALQSLFEANDRVLDTRAIYDLAVAVLGLG